MRKLIFAINITADGSCDHTTQLPDEEVHRYFSQLLREIDVHVFGRKTYELMVPYWPDIAKNPTTEEWENEFAREFVSTRKVVFSRTAGGVEDKNTRVVSTNLHDEMVKLKQETGKGILVGGVDVSSQLIKLGLVDEYRFVVGPVIAGEGRRLLEGVSLEEKLRLKLVDAKVFKSGCVAHRYVKG